MKKTYSELNKFHLLTGIFLFSFLFFCGCRPVENNFAELEKGFSNPPDSARPGVYWYFMDGNLSREAMTKDLESMKKAGIGYVVYLEVNVGVPRGTVDFLSPEWKALFKHAVEECERLGIAITLGVGPGWTGSGGPWVEAQASMRHLVASTIQIQGAGKKNGSATCSFSQTAILWRRGIHTSGKKTMGYLL